MLKLMTTVGSLEMLGRNHLSIYGTVSIVHSSFNCGILFLIGSSMHYLSSETDALSQSLRKTGLATDYPSGPNVGGISSQLKLIAQLIATRNERGNGINRDVFYCEMAGEIVLLSAALDYFV